MSQVVVHLVTAADLTGLPVKVRRDTNAARGVERGRGARDLIAKVPTQTMISIIRSKDNKRLCRDRLKKLRNRLKRPNVKTALFNVFEFI